MKMLKLNKSGYSIIELAIATGVLLLALVIIFSMAFAIQNNIGITTGILDISQKGRLAINRISKDIREAKTVISSFGGYSTGNATVILSIPSIDVNGDIIDPDTYVDKIIYTLDSADPEILLRIVDANAASSRQDGTETVTGDIDTLLFSSGGVELSSVPDKPSIKNLTVKIVTTVTWAGTTRLYETITSTSLRNKEGGA